MTSAGGSLRNIPESELPKQALIEEINYIKNYGVEFKLDQNVSLDYFEKIKKEFDAVVMAIGDHNDLTETDSKNNLGFENLVTDKDTFATNIDRCLCLWQFCSKAKYGCESCCSGKTWLPAL